MLHTSGGYRFAVIAAADRLDLHKAAEALDVRRGDLRFASEADMAADFSQHEVGAIPRIGPDTPVEPVELRLLDYGHCYVRRVITSTRLVVDPTGIVRVTGARSWTCASDKPRA